MIVCSEDRGPCWSPEPTPTVASAELRAVVTHIEAQLGLLAVAVLLVTAAVAVLVLTEGR